MLKVLKNGRKLVKLKSVDNFIKRQFNSLIPTRIFNTPKFHISAFKYCTSIADIDIAKITNGNPQLETKLQVLILETEVLRQEGRLVPENAFLKLQHWQELMILPSKTSRQRFLEYLFKLQKTKENRQIKKQAKKLERESIPKAEVTDESDTLQYGLQHNHILLRIYETTINQLYNNRLIQAMQFGQKLVVDCGYYNNMTLRENKNCAKQLTLLFAENRFHDDPFDLYFCNADPKSDLMEQLHRYIATLYEPWFPLNICEKSYLDLFPKDKLVYLTPHCREEMSHFNHDDIYIIGGIVDKVNNEPLSLAKAKKEGLRMSKFPLDHYLQWGSGSGKSLTLNQVASILLDVKAKNDWNFALRHVPRRKIADPAQSSVINTYDSHLSYDKDKSHSIKKSWKPAVTLNYKDDKNGKTFRNDKFEQRGNNIKVNMREIIK